MNLVQEINTGNVGLITAAGQSQLQVNVGIPENHQIVTSRHGVQ